MAFFNFKTNRDEQNNMVSTQSVQTMRRRAKQRLIGAAVLVLLGLVAFPLLFDAQPRPISVDTPIAIPDRDKAKLNASTSVPAKNSKKVDAQSSLDKSEEIVTPSESPVVVDGKSVALPVTAAAATVAAVVAVQGVKKVTLKKQQPKSDARTDATQEAAAPNDMDEPAGKTDLKVAQKAVPKSSPAVTHSDTKKGRYIVQTGVYTFAEIEKARAARKKIEQNGIKTYTQVVGSGQERKIRVRIGPFANKEQADKAAIKMKKLGLTDGIYEL